MYRLKKHRHQPFLYLQIIFICSVRGYGDINRLLFRSKTACYFIYTNKDGFFLSITHFSILFFIESTRNA